MFLPRVIILQASLRSDIVDVERFFSFFARRSNYHKSRARGRMSKARLTSSPKLTRFSRVDVRLFWRADWVFYILYFLRMPRWILGQG